MRIFAHGSSCAECSQGARHRSKKVSRILVGAVMYRVRYHMEKVLSSDVAACQKRNLEGNPAILNR
jgi:hypothetical protein